MFGSRTGVPRDYDLGRIIRDAGAEPRRASLPAHILERGRPMVEALRSFATER